MNLQFITVGKSDIAYIQKANVTQSREFWAAWNYAKALEAQAMKLGCDPPEHILTSLISLKRETIDNTDYWFAYRQVPIDDAGKPIHFPLSYILSDGSKLLPFQVEAVRHLCNSIVTHGAALDGSDTGIGKTYMALACARDLRYRPAIVCKKAGIAGWKKACNYFDIKPLFIVNWEYAKSLKFPYIERIENRYSKQPDFKWIVPAQTLLIFDEAHSANNPASLNGKIYTASKGIPSISCSATIADKPTKLAPLFHVLSISAIDKFQEWLQKRNSYFINRYDKVEFLDEMDEMIKFNKILYPVYGYRLAYDNPQVKKYFPDAVYQTHVITIGEKAAHEQNEMYRKLLIKIDYYKDLGKQAEKMVAEMRFRQAAELMKCDALCELAQDYMEQGHSVCIFVNYKETLAYLSRKLDTKSLIFGEQDKYKIPREETIENFQSNKVKIIIAMVDAGGQSINLHDLHGGHPRISLICPTYDSIKLKQVMGRTYRAGCKTTPVIKLVYAAGTIEEKVADSVNKKLANISALNDGDLDLDFFQMRKK